MSSVQHLKEFVCSRLCAAAEEIFGEFEKTILQYEKERNDQRNLMNLTWKPQVKLTRIQVLPQYFDSPKRSSDPPPEEPGFSPVQVQQPALEKETILGQKKPAPVKNEVDTLQQLIQVEDSNPEKGEPVSDLVKNPEIPSNQQSIRLVVSSINQMKPIKCEKDLWNEQSSSEDLSSPNHEKPVPAPVKDELIPSDQQSDWEVEENSSMDSEETESLGEVLSYRDLDWEEESHLDQDEPEMTKDGEVHLQSHPTWEEDQSQPEPGPVRDEQEYSYARTVEELHVLKLDPDSFMTTVQNEQDELELNCDLFLSQNPPLIEDIDKEISNDEQMGPAFLKQMQPKSNSSSNETGCDVAPQKKPFVCNVCGKIFKFKYILISHYRTHTGERPFTCKICGRGFTQLSALRVHMRVHSGEIFTCITCGKTFRSRNGLNTHKKIHNGKEALVCRICDNTLKDESALASHIEHHKKLCKVCGKVFPVNELSKHMKVHPLRKTFSCDICGKLYARNCALTDHMTTHTGDRSFACDICGKRSSKKSNLVKHMRTHSSKEPHTCETCGKCFTRSSSLSDHVKIHSGVRPFNCSLCGKSFIQKSQLKTHMNIHTDERPHSCQFCQKSFRRKYDLSVHLETHFVTVLSKPGGEKSG